MSQNKIVGLTAAGETAVQELMQEMDIAPLPLTFVQTEGKGLRLERSGNGVRISYSHRSQVGRAVSLLPAFLAGGEETLEQTRNVEMLCYMADVSRNAVLNLPAAKQLLRDLAKMGYDSMMLYTEDTFRLPGYPYFGHMRGAYSEEELRELDDYADALGIELIPCVQTLAHLATALRWSEMNDMVDTGDILLVGEEKTYRFIRDVFAFCRRVFRSRRINIGMDEAHMLGRGRYMDKNGPHPKPEIMLRHLNEVTRLAEEAGFWPMMWSDMFFRMAFDGQYYVRTGSVPSEVIRQVPQRLSLIYWDYYSLDRELFTHMVDCHLQFQNPVVFAGGAWKWYGFAPHNRFSLRSTKMQLQVCRQRGLDNIIVTGWGDDGGEASQFAVLPMLLYFSEAAYTDAPGDELLEARCRALFRIGFEQLLTLDAPNELPGIARKADHPLNPSRYLLFNDPLEGLLDAHTVPEQDALAFAENAKRLLALSEHPRFGRMYKTLGLLCHVLEKKCDLGIRIRRAYSEGDKAALLQIAQEDIPRILSRLDRFIDVFRLQWYSENKTFGFSAQEQRLGGLRLRLQSTAERLSGYVEGQWDRIEELEQPVLPFNHRYCGAEPYIYLQSWKQTVAPGLL